MKLIRLDKMLSHMGYGSRKEVKEIIRKGFVYVNDIIIYDDDYKVNEDNDDVIIDGIKIDYDNLVYIMLNKPADYVSATYDSRFPTVIDLVDEYRGMKIFPMGRLDIDTEGLLILTNDGNLAHKLLSPKYHVDKKYYVEYSGEMSILFETGLKNGIILDDGYKSLPGSMIRINDNSCYIIIHEGKFHQVKRMFQAYQMEVTYLKRVEFGNIKLDENLKLGEYRKLSNEELSILMDN